MTYPYVQARWYTPGAIIEPRAILWHMAEGAGTVSWLTHPSGDNSAHYVVELSGRIVQMVKLADASHSAHVAFDPGGNDADDCGTYGLAIARDVVGADGIADINRYVIAVEVEGFRKDGPRPVQADAIVELWLYLVGKLPSLRGNLGHRDVQDYKSCPGCKFPFARIGGHGLWEDSMGLRLTIDTPALGRLSIPTMTDAIRVSDGQHYAVPGPADRDAYTARLAPTGSGGYLVDLRDDELHFIRRSEPGLVFTPPAPAPDSGEVAALQAKIDAAKAALA